MDESGAVLTLDEDSVLEIFKVRLVSKGVGLTRDILASELRWVSDDELEAALRGLVARGLLSNPPFYQKIYLLTPEGRRYIDENLAPP